MSILTSDEYGIEIDVNPDTGAIALAGELVSTTDDGTTFTKTTTVFALETTQVSWTRQDVLTALYKNIAITARVFGPMSTEVEELEADVDAVKAGGELAPYGWMFGEE